MFKYNELSDLIDGSLVTPLSMEDDGTVLCLTENNEKKYYTFDDFDFSKKVEDRKIPEPIPESTPEPIPESTPEPIPESTPEPIPESTPEENNNPTINDIIEEMGKDQDDSYYDGTDDTEAPEYPPEEIPIEEDEEGFLTKKESNEIVDFFGLGDKRYNYKVWKDIITLT